ncbi:MAG: hypothetical protein OHK0038_21740 [Flammeovirgaceae bacterium]
MKLRQILIVIGIMGIIGGAYGINRFLASQKKDPQKKPSIAQKRFVRTEKVRYSDIPTEIVAYGRVTSAQPLDLITEVAGRIKQGEITLKAGQKFQKGALIFATDDTEAKLTLQATKSSFMKQVAAILPDFKIDYPASYEKWNQYFQQIEVDKPLPELPQPASAKEKTYLAMKDIFTQYYNIKSAEERLAKYKFYAPFNGSISEVFLEIGSFAGVGGKVARIVKTDQLELRASVETSDIQWIGIGKEVEVSTEDGTMTWKGRILRINDVVNQTTQSLDVFIAIQPNKFAIYDGMYLKATIPGIMVKGGMLIPRNAVFDGNKVFVIEEDSILKSKEIKIHKINKETIIFSGIPAGADLVYEQLINAQENTKMFKLENK